MWWPAFVPDAKQRTTCQMILLTTMSLRRNRQVKTQETQLVRMNMHKKKYLPKSQGLLKTIHFGLSIRIWLCNRRKSHENAWAKAPPLFFSYQPRGWWSFRRCAECAVTLWNTLMCNASKQHSISVELEIRFKISVKVKHNRFARTVPCANSENSEGWFGYIVQVSDLFGSVQCKC